MDGLKLTKKKIEERINESNKKWEDLVNKGWEETPDGLLPPEEIERAGFVKQDDEWKIPTDVYIAEVAMGGIKRGSKYIGVSMKYINWREERKLKYKNVESRIEREIEKQSNIITQEEKGIKNLIKEFGGTLVNDKPDILEIPFI